MASPRVEPPGLRGAHNAGSYRKAVAYDGTVRVIEDISKIEFTRKLLSESKKLGLKKPLLLMDCEFSSVDVMRFLDECSEKFLMAVSKMPGIKKAVSVSLRQKKGNIKIRDEIRRRNNIQVLAGGKKASQGKEGQEKMGISDVCHKCRTVAHKTHHERHS